MLYFCINRKDTHMKTTIFAIISFSCLTLTASAQTNPQPDSIPPAQGWVQLTSGTTASLGSLSIVNTDTIWAGGAKVIRSTNGGATWDSTAQGHAGFIDALDDTNLISWGGGPAIYRTSNGGISWDTINTRVPLMTAIAFPTRDSGCLLGAGISHTSDAGADWVQFTNIDEPLSHMYGMAFPDSKHGYIVGDPANWQPQPTWPGATCFARTTDGGANWHVVYTGDTLNKSHTGMYFQAFGIAAASIDTLIAVGLQIGRSTDAGNTWDTIPYPGADWNNGFIAVTFPDARHGTAVGSSGWILHTTDAGLTWTRQISPALGNLNSVNFLDSNIGYACGGSGTIIMTTNGGLSWVRISPVSLNTVQGTVYPQPSSARTNLAYNLPESQHVNLSLNNVTGEKVADVLIDELQSTGPQSVQINTSNLPCGTYFLRFQSEKYFFVVKLDVLCS
jgi:photosystem II stability/assembly factor-like uncharacterized protein